jgi:catechol 2,3-dioxygenase-like lactoylglutathione lyase family enzyme
VSLHHLALRVADPRRSAAFYAAALGLPALAEHADADGQTRAVWLGLGDAVLMLERSLRGEGPADGSGHVLVVAVADLAAAEARLAAAGVAVVDRTEFSRYFTDPDGHRVGVSAFRFPPR